MSLDGRSLRVARTEAHLPTALSAFVAAIDGLSQNPVHHDHVDGATGNADPATVDAFVVGTPCSSYWGQTKAKASAAPPYNGSQRPYDALRVHAEATPLGVRRRHDPAGRHRRDRCHRRRLRLDAGAGHASTWSVRHGIPALRSDQYDDQTIPGVSAIPEDPTGFLDPDGWSEEQTLDVEAVHAMAPGANIVYVGAATPFNFALNATLAQVIEGDLADELSNSWGSSSDSPDPSDQLVFDQLMSDAAVKGIGVQFSSGDDGDELEATGTRTADFPATSPMVTAVGGTTLEVSSRGKNLGETYWGTRRHHS